MKVNEKKPGLVKLKGTIKNYTVTRASASFVFTDDDRNAMGIVAIAAGISGSSGPAIATASNAASMEEDADHVEFDLDGNSIKGWVWRSPFAEGDDVEVAAEWQDGHYEAAGITRPKDRMIALHPHCSRGRRRHVMNAVKWWLIGSAIFDSMPFILSILTGPTTKSFENDEGQAYIYLVFFIFFGIMTFSLARKWMPFARLAEKIFTTLNLPNPTSIDLIESSKAQKKSDDPGEFGTFYFRY